MRVRAICAALAAWLFGAASAHDLVTAEAVERYLGRTDADLALIRSRATAEKRAEALYDLARRLDEIRDLLNRDIGTHGKVQGLPSNLLVSQLQVRGVTFAVAPETGRFPAAVSYYREALRLAPDVRQGDAAFRLLQGAFYDAFDTDPLKPRLSWTQVQEQIRLGEQLARRQPPHPEIEEIRFIVAAHYVQASVGAPDAVRARLFAERARTAGADFAARYPDSLRRAALEAMTASLPR